jgi:nucleotide-binding universal stress UspA family protein
MKILVPTDFSPNSRTALEYALCLFGNHNPEVVILNTWQIPHTGTGMLVSIEDLLRADAEKSMHELVAGLTISAQNISNLRGEVKEGALNDVIRTMNRKEQFDYVIMGTNGADDLHKKIIGSNTANAMRSTKVPLIIIPEGTVCKQPKRIALATDFQPLNGAATNHIGRFAQLTMASFEAVHVNEKVVSGSSKSDLGFQLGGLSPEVVHVVSDNVSSGLDSYLNAGDIDLLIMVRRDYGLFERIFHKSVSRTLAMHTKTPLLVIPE